MSVEVLQQIEIDDLTVNCQGRKRKCEIKCEAQGLWRCVEVTCIGIASEEIDA